jgi:hypothetical protein
LPIEFPTSFWLAANLQPAKPLGLTVRPTACSCRRGDRMSG